MDAAKEHAKNRYHFDVEIISILVEKDKDTFERLIENLVESGVDRNRIKVNPDRLSPNDGEIIAINSDFLDRSNEILTVLAKRYTNSFVLLDPFGMKGIPYDVVSQFVRLPSVDVMINWPFLDL